MSARRTLVPAMIAGFAVRVAIIPFLYTEWLDPFVVEHWAFGRVARSIALGHGFGNPFADTGATALLPPVYAYLLSGIFSVFGPNTAASVIAAAAVNSLISVLTCVPVYFIALRCFGERAAKWAAWAWAFSPYGIYFSADWLWSTCLFTLLLAAVFLYSLWLEETGRLSAWAGFGLLAAAAALTEPVGLAVVPILAGISCYRLRSRGKRWLAAAVAAAVAAITALSPWIARNYALFHRFIPVRDGYGLELYIGNNGYTSRWVNSALHPNHSAAELAEYERLGEPAYMDRKRDRAISFIRSHPGWFAWMSARRALYLWTGFWSFDPAYLKDEPLDPPNILVACSLSFLALAGLWTAFRRKNPQALRFAATFVCFPVVYYVSHPEAYYLRPLDPLIAIAALYAVESRFHARDTAHA